MATTAQSLLAVYGALDRAVTGTGDPEIEATVERYLPGSTGANAGWYDELLGWLGLTGPGVVEPIEIPELSEALTSLRDRHRGANDTEPEPLSTVQLSRMIYAIGALSNLPTYYRPDEWDEQFAGTLDLAAPTEESGRGMLELMRRDFRGRDSWPRLMLSFTDFGLIREDVALVPQCDIKYKWVRGHLCVVLTTDFTSQKVSLDSLKNVVDPLNWAKCLPSFFCEMDKLGPRADGWNRVLEQVSTTCPISGTPRMVTALKYWNGPQQGEVLPIPSAWVNYALDDDPLPGNTGDGRMVVDEGFIRMTATANDSALPGVTVRTRKVAGFRNLVWIAGGIFACAMGYGAEGVEMLLGGVAKRPAGGAADWTDWQPSKLPSTATPPPPPGGSTPPQSPAQPPPAPGGDAPHHAVKVAVNMLNECIDDMAKQSAALATKWAAGEVPIAESVDFSTGLAARLATDPWRYLARLRDAVQGGGK